MRTIASLLATAVTLALGVTPALAGGEQLVSSPFVAGGYPGAAPAPGGCVAAPYDANFSESVLAAQPGWERLVGGAKAYFNRWSTYKAYHTAAFVFRGAQASTHVIGGFDCATTRTQAMP